jgi:hypothetical protein
MNPLSWLRRIRRFDTFIGRDPSNPRGPIPHEVRPLGPEERILLGTVTVNLTTGEIIDEERVHEKKTPLIESA